MPQYVMFRYDTAAGAAFDTLPEDPTERPAWIGVISQRLRAGQYRPVGRLSLTDAAGHKALPPASGHLYVSYGDGGVFVCPGGEIQGIGNLAALLGYPNLADAPPGSVVQFDTTPEGWGVDCIVTALQNPDLRGTIAGDAAGGGSIEGQIAEMTSILIEALERLPRLKTVEDKPVTVPMVFPAIRLKAIST